MGDLVKQILAKPIQLADQIVKASDHASSFKQECQELKSKTEKLLTLLRQAARASNDLYERPTRRIMDDTEQVLEKALALVIKCGGNGIIKRMFTIIPVAAFRKMLTQLENSIGDVSWLLRVSAPADDRDDGYLGLPPIAANEPILCLIWEQIVILHTGSLDERSDAAASLVSLARDNDRYGKLIIEEGGIVPLLKLAKEGKMEGQESAARALGLLGRDPESVEQIVNCGVCTVFAKILKDGPMKVQTVVAWAVSELAANHPKCQDHFAENNVIRLLVSHLAFETVQEHSRYAIANKQKMTIHSVYMASNTRTPEADQNQNQSQNVDDDNGTIPHPMGNQTPSQVQRLVTSSMANSMAVKAQASASTSQNHAKNQVKSPPPIQKHDHQNHHHCHHQQQHVSLAGTSIKGRGFEDPATKAQMKAMAARALWHLCKGNLAICRSITESRALLCFAILLEKGQDEVRYNSAMALMEITAVADQHAELRRSAFKPTSPAAKAVVEQFLKIIDNADSDLLIPCIMAIGNLARTFRATENRIISPLVRLLDEKEAEISREAVISLTQFACTENFLHDNHCKAIITAGGAKHLIQLVYFGEQMLQIPAVILLCYIAMHVPDSEELAQEEVLIVLEWATKQAHLAHDPTVEMLLPEAKSRMELYQSRISRY
ncbi:hypothetical protein RJ641_013955 [Dillenia turbinata]|uniref:DUF7792 domain-containing protein n=1 Tax=Dillenia turbinata TaxID=194707 RepID=A0AAN8ZQI4_9MAGN